MTYYTELTSTQEQQLLTLYDYCNKISRVIVTDDVKIIERNGMLSMTDIHWFQLMTEYIVPILLEKKYFIQDTFFTRCLQHKTQHPVDFLYEKYEAIINNEPLNKETRHDYVLQAEAKESKKKEKERNKK